MYSCYILIFTSFQEIIYSFHPLYLYAKCNNYHYISPTAFFRYFGFIYKGEMLWQGDRHTILDTDCQTLRDYVCANTLARNIIEGKGR